MDYKIGSSFGNSIDAVEITNGAVTFEKLESSIQDWEHLETLTFSAETTKTSGTLTAYDEYLLKFRSVTGSATDNIQIRLNGDTATNYFYTDLTNVTLTKTSNGTTILVTGITTTGSVVGEVIIGGKSKAIASGGINVVMNTQGTNNVQGLIGYWLAGNATQVSTITILTNGTASLTGNVEIWGRNKK